MAIGGWWRRGPHGSPWPALSDVQASLLYDAVALLVLGVVALLTHGTVRLFVLAWMASTVVKAPYDVWVARRPDRDHDD